MNDLAILLIHYNRIELLKRTLGSLRKIFQNEVDYIVADDSSSATIIKQINDLKIKLIQNEGTKGTGGNTNSGLLGIKNKYIFQIQDDFEIRNNNRDLIEIITNVMNLNQDIDIIRFFGVPKNLRVKETRIYRGYKILIYDNNPILNFPYSFNLYSDTPHLKRIEFHQKYGLYHEYPKMEWTETEFSMRCLKNKATIASIEKINNIFVHNGEERSYRNKSKIKSKFSSIYLQCLKMLFAYFIYRITRVFPKVLYN